MLISVTPKNIPLNNSITDVIDSMHLNFIIIRYQTKWIYNWTCKHSKLKKEWQTKFKSLYFDVIEDIIKPIPIEISAIKINSGK